MTMCSFFNLKSDRNSDTVGRPSVTLSEISITIPEVTPCPELKKIILLIYRETRCHNMSIDKIDIY